MSTSSRQAVTTKDAPATGAHLSQAVIHKDLVFCSGALGIDPKNGKLVEGTIADRTIQCLKNLTAVLEAAGSAADKVLKVNIFVSDMKDVPKMNEAYTAFFAEPRPARACVAVAGMAFGTDVEIECTGYIAPRANL